MKFVKIYFLRDHLINTPSLGDFQLCMFGGREESLQHLLARTGDPSNTTTIKRNHRSTVDVYFFYVQVGKFRWKVTKSFTVSSKILNLITFVICRESIKAITLFPFCIFI